MIKIYLMSIDKLTEEDEELIRVKYPKRYAAAVRYRLEDGRRRSFTAGMLIDKIIGEDVSYDDRGKPYLEKGPYISISHSGGYAALAVSDSPVGMDIQRWANIQEKVISRISTDKERIIMRRYGDLRAENLWTMKEAVVKYLGIGITVDLKSIPCDELLTLGETVMDDKMLYGYTGTYRDYSIGLVAEEPAYDTKIVIV